MGGEGGEEKVGRRRWGGGSGEEKVGGGGGRGGEEMEGGGTQDKARGRWRGQERALRWRTSRWGRWDGGRGDRATFTIAYLMSSSPLGRGICCKIDANCLTLSSSRGDCSHSNQRRFGASEVRSGCPGGRTGKQDTSHAWFKRHTSPLQSYVQMKKEGEREGEREGLMLTSLI